MHVDVDLLDALGKVEELERARAGLGRSQEAGAIALLVAVAFRCRSVRTGNGDCPNLRLVDERKLRPLGQLQGVMDIFGPAPLLRNDRGPSGVGSRSQTSSASRCSSEEPDGQRRPAQNRRLILALLVTVFPPPLFAPPFPCFAIPSD